jgi:hypothetical protein
MVEKKKNLFFFNFLEKKKALVTIHFHGPKKKEFFFNFLEKKKALVIHFHGPKKKKKKIQFLGKKKGVSSKVEIQSTEYLPTHRPTHWIRSF